MSTVISLWGNSSAVRIPAKVLSQSRYRLGDRVVPIVNGRGNIELVSPAEGHRKLAAPGRVSSAELYERFPIGETRESEAWPNEDMVGAEWVSWSE